MAQLVITRIVNGSDFYFKFEVDGGTPIENSRNDLLAVGTQLHFKTANGANIIQKQEIYPADVTIIAGSTYNGFTTVEQVFNKLLDVGYFDWFKNGGGGGATAALDILEVMMFA